MSQHVEPSLLESVDKVDERAGRPGVGHQQEYLRTPELDVGLARVQQEQVLAHLEKQYEWVSFCVESLST